MGQISKRLSVEGPDAVGDYELTLDNCTDGIEYTFINRAQADALIAALQEPIRDAHGHPIAPPQHEIAPRPAGPHLSNGDARKPVE